MSDLLKPGARWVEIVRRSDADFPKAFIENVVLEASVLNAPLTGAMAIRAFFTATRGMYDEIAFSHEIRAEGATVLEWQGKAFREPVAGVTILKFDSDGLIERIGLYHNPFQLVLKCSHYLEQVLAGKVDPKRG